MATTDTTNQPDAAPGQSLARTLTDAEFVHFVVAQEGDSVAAAGVLGRGLTAVGTPFQVSTVATPQAAGRRVESGDPDSTVVGVGVTAGGSDDEIEAVPRSRVAFNAVDALAGADPDPVLALAGVVASGRDIEATPDILEAVDATGVERRPGVGVPTSDVEDGLVHSTLVTGPFSAAPAGTKTRVEDLDTVDPLGGRAVASMVAIATVEGATPSRAAAATERILHPVAIDGPFESVAGYGDVLAATARTTPGTAIAVALGHGGVEAALQAWRDHGRMVHGAIDDATWDRYPGLIHVTVDAPVAATARLLRDFRAPEPAVLVTNDNRTALATTDADAATLLRTAATREQVTGHATLATTPTIDVLDAVREALE